MTLNKLMLVPVEASYAAQTPGSEVMLEMLDGGAPAIQLDIIGAASPVNVQFIADKSELQYIYSFFRNRMARGSEKFLIDMMVETGTLTEYTATLVPGSLGFTVSSGIYTVTAQLYADAVAEDSAYDSSYVDVWEASDGDPSRYADLLAAAIAALPAA